MPTILWPFKSHHTFLFDCLSNWPNAIALETQSLFETFSLLPVDQKTIRNYSMDSKFLLELLLENIHLRSSVGSIPIIEFHCFGSSKPIQKLFCWFAEFFDFYVLIAWNRLPNQLWVRLNSCSLPVGIRDFPQCQLALKLATAKVRSKRFLVEMNNIYPTNNLLSVCLKNDSLTLVVIWMDLFCSPFFSWSSHVLRVSSVDILLTCY